MSTPPLSEKLTRVVLTLCHHCLDGVGGECHTPGCALWMNRAPDVPLRDKVEAQEVTQASEAGATVVGHLILCEDCAKGRAMTGAPLSRRFTPMIYHDPFFALRNLALRARWALRPPQVVLWGGRPLADYQFGSGRDLRRARAMDRRAAALRKMARAMRAMQIKVGRDLMPSMAQAADSMRRFVEAWNASMVRPRG